MKATGIVRRIDDLGRVVIPKEIRRTMQIKEGDPLELFLEDDKVCFKLYSSGCEDDIERLINSVKDDDYAIYDKNKVLELLGEARKVMAKLL